MELFSHINKKYHIKCHNKLFQKNIIENFDKNHHHHNEAMHIGLNHITEDFKTTKRRLNIVILGHEYFDEKIIHFFLKKKENINFYTLSLIEQEFYKENFQINSKILCFDLPKLNIEKNKKILFFYKINDNGDFDNNKDFNSYISESSNLFSDIKSFKIIFLEPLKGLHNPYINIAITNNVPIEHINFYHISFTDVLNNFKKDINDFDEKYYFYRNNFIKINNFLYLLTHTKKYIVNKILDEELKKTVDRMYNINDNSEMFVVLSDNFEYLKSITNNIILKIYITSNNQYIIKKIENNFICINKYFFDEKVQDTLKKYHSKNKVVELENKYTTFEEAKLYQIIINNEEDIENVKNYLNLWNKYNIKTPINVYSNFSISFTNENISYFTIDEFSLFSSSYILYSSTFDMTKYFNNMILMDYIEVKKINKITVLVSSTQYPSYGGAATNAYNIIKYFGNNTNIRTIGIFIDSCEDIYDKANPDDVKDVIGLNYRDFTLFDIKSKIIEKFNCIPDIAFCKNCMAPKLIKSIFSNCINIFLVSGLMGFTQIECGANEITNFVDVRRSQEEKSIEMSNLIICNSDLTIEYFRKIYNDIIQDKLLNNPIDTTKYNVMHGVKSIKEKRTIDIIAVASNVNRSVKNVKFVKDIITFDKRFRKKKIVIIGENTQELFGDLEENYNIEIISLIKQQEVESYLRKSKIIIIPSLFDSNSNVFREAVFAGVIPFISCNVAHPKKYPNFLKLETYDAVEWAYKIMYVLDNHHETTQKYNLQNLFSNNDDLMDFVL